MLPKSLWLACNVQIAASDRWHAIFRGVYTDATYPEKKIKQRRDVLDAILGKHFEARTELRQVTLLSIHTL
jgi:hypothetical protein